MKRGRPRNKEGNPAGRGERPKGGEGTGREGVGGRQQRVIWDTKAGGRNGRGAPPALFLFLLFPSCLIGAFMVGIVHGRVGGRVRRWKDRIFFRLKGHESDKSTGTASCQVTLEKKSRVQHLLSCLMHEQLSPFMSYLRRGSSLRFNYGRGQSETFLPSPRLLERREIAAA